MTDLTRSAQIPAKRLVVASRNAGKIREIRRLLAGVPLEVVGLDSYPDMPELDEPFATFAENAAHKAQTAAEYAGAAALADDSGLEVAALDDRPGVYSSRYAPSDPERIARLLDEMKGLAGDQRRARFVCVIALADHGRLLGTWQETVEGRIAEAPRGTSGFGFDPVFLYCSRTFAEMTPEEKNDVSHRGKALRAFARDVPRRLDELR